jgi:hypothetical protein
MRHRQRSLRTLVLVGCLASAASVLAACTERGPFEEAGEEIDDAINDIADEIDDELDEL